MKVKLLLADDSTLVRKNIIRLLQSIDRLEISESKDAESTVIKLKENNPDILLLDLRMPNGSGFDVLRYLKQQGRRPVVIILTNSSNTESRQRCLREGADFFFDKSREHKEAIRLIKEIAEKEREGGIPPQNPKEVLNG